MTASRAVSISPIRVLVADDDPATRMMLDTALSERGHEVISVEDGEAAWCAINKTPAPQILILDGHMPGQDGYALCARIRNELSSTYHPYIILLTQDGGSENVVKGLDAGANEFLTKPFHAAELRSRIAVGEKIVRYEAGLNEKNDELKQYIEKIEAASALADSASTNLDNLIKGANSADEKNAERLDNLKIAHSAVDEIVDVFKNFQPEKSAKKPK